MVIFARGEHGLKAVNEQSQFLLCIRRSHAPGGVETDTSGKIPGGTHQHGVAE